MGEVAGLGGRPNARARSKGFDYLGEFFPGTGDARCPSPQCGSCCPSFTPLGGTHLYYHCDNAYWLGNYSWSRDAPDRQTFVPRTLRKQFDSSVYGGGSSSASRGFWDAASARYLHWTWAFGPSDAVPGLDLGWDGMLSVAREFRIDHALEVLQPWAVNSFSRNPAYYYR